MSPDEWTNTIPYTDTNCNGTTNTVGNRDDDDDDDVFVQISIETSASF